MPLYDSILIDLPFELSREFKLYFFPKIASTHKNHRTHLRCALVEILKSMGLKPSEEKKLLDLNQLPDCIDFSLSLSHSPKGSLILIANKKISVGTDIEVAKRISSRVLKRVSVGDEYIKCPKGFDLFTSKEACWKATNYLHQIETISQVETVQWETLIGSWWKFNAKINDQLIDGAGYTCRFEPFFISFYILGSTFSRKHRQRL